MKSNQFLGLFQSADLEESLSIEAGAKARSPRSGPHVMGSARNSSKPASSNRMRSASQSGCPARCSMDRIPYGCSRCRN